MMVTDCVVVKIGGSLFDLPDLGPRLSRWLRPIEDARVVLVPGGGPAAEVIRAYDRSHHLGEQASHWLALRMLQVNAHFLADLLAGAVIVTSPREPVSLAMIDAYAFAREDETQPGRLPHTWSVTSDSVAARVACVAEARELVLLKSVAWSGSDWQAAACQGSVDAYFPQVLRQRPELRVRLVNLRG
jgi:aspartokinase-like uncharacterized kinase